jgi:hypothetical protein
MKYENTRIVTFQEDYFVKAKDAGADGKGRKLLHKKGSRHAMHKGIVAILEKNGAKIKVEQVDAKKIEEKLKAKAEAAKRKAFTVTT